MIISNLCTTQNLHKLIRYLLTPSVSERPDIYQASYLAFQLRSKKTPIQNLHHLACPDWAELSLKLSPATTSQKPPAAASSSTSATAAPPAAAASSGFSSPRAGPVEPSVTSVQPRSRPKGAAGLKTLPLPLQETSLSGKQAEGEESRGARGQGQTG